MLVHIQINLLARHTTLTPCSDSSMASLPGLVAYRTCSDQLKRQIPPCHSIYDLEVAAQDLWAHLPQDNFRLLISILPVCVAACITAGGGPTRYGICIVFV